MSLADDTEGSAANHLETSLTAVKAHFQQAKKRLAKQTLWIDGVVLKPDIRKAVEADMEDALEWLRHRVAEAQQELQDVGAAAARKQLKAQERAFAFKLETSRTAAKTQLQNNAHELAAAHQRALQDTVSQMNGGSALLEATARIAELESELSTMTTRCKSAEEMLSTTTALYRKSEKQLLLLEKQIGRSQADVQRLEMQEQTQHRVVYAHLTGVGFEADEKVSLAELVNVLISSHQDAIGCVGELHAMKAERVGMMAEIHMFETLKKEHAAIQEKLQTVLQSLNIKIDENRTLSENIAELLASFEALKFAQQESAAIVKTLTVELEALRLACSAEAQLEFATMKKEHAAIQEKLKAVLHTLNIKVDENRTLSEHIAELLASFEALKVAKAGLEEDLVNARAEFEFKQLKLEETIHSKARRIAELEQEVASGKEDLEAIKHASQAELRQAKEDYERELSEQTLALKRDMAECSDTLGDLLDWGVELKSTHRSLKDQAVELVSRYRVADSEMQRIKANNEEMKRIVDEMMVEFEQQMNDVRREWRGERQRLVQASLRSLQQLRLHIFHSMELGEEDLGRVLNRCMLSTEPARGLTSLLDATPGLTSLARSMPSLLHSSPKPATSRAPGPISPSLGLAWAPHHSQRALPSLLIGPSQTRPWTAAGKESKRAGPAVVLLHAKDAHGTSGNHNAVSPSRPGTPGHSAVRGSTPLKVSVPGPGSRPVSRERDLSPPGSLRSARPDPIKNEALGPNVLATIIAYRVPVEKAFNTDHSPEKISRPKSRSTEI